MSKPLVVSIPHRLGKAEATRRIQEGLGWARDKYGALVSISTTDWTDGDMAFQLGALVVRRPETQRGLLVFRLLVRLFHIWVKSFLVAT